MFEREDRFVAMEYDDCDVTVTSGGQTIDEHMRSIGFQVQRRSFSLFISFSLLLSVSLAHTLTCTHHRYTLSHPLSYTPTHTHTHTHIQIQNPQIGGIVIHQKQQLLLSEPFSQHLSFLRVSKTWLVRQRRLAALAAQKQPRMTQNRPPIQQHRMPKRRKLASNRQILRRKFKALFLDKRMLTAYIR